MHLLYLCGKFKDTTITDVVFTRLHWDHCNGVVLTENEGLKLLFPNATHWCSKTQWEHSKISNIRERAAYYPEILNFIDLLCLGILVVQTIPGLL